MSAIGGKPADICSLRDFRILTNCDIGGCLSAPDTERAAGVAREATDVATCDAGMPPRPWSLESAVAVAVMFGAHMIEQAKLLSRRRCHADLHLARAFYFGRRQGHAG